MRLTGTNLRGRRLSTALFCVVFSFVLYYPWAMSFSILNPTSTGLEAFFAIGAYFLVLSVFLLITLYLAWTDRTLKDVERPVKQITNYFKPLHLLEWCFFCCRVQCSAFRLTHVFCGCDVGCLCFWTLIS